MLVALTKQNYRRKMNFITGCLSSCNSDNARAVNVWDAFGCETMGDYHDVYLQLDVLLLADFFEKFRRTCQDFYKLDPLHYYTTPGLAWDAALRMSRVDLELITNENIYNMIENSIRGGISMISTRHAKANNPSLASTYDPDLPRQDLIYLDANNLYGHAMSQYLPTGGFRLLDDEEVEALDLDSLDDEMGTSMKWAYSIPWNCTINMMIIRWHLNHC